MCLGGDTENKEQALLEAVDAGDLTGVAAFLDAGADINDQRNDIIHSTPLHIACYAGPGGEAMSRLLLARGADISLFNFVDHTALHAAASSGQQRPVRDGHVTAGHEYRHQYFRKLRARRSGNL